MSSDQIRISYLEEFAALAATLNYSKVAKSRYLSTSALSKHIVSLENSLGETLFVRNANSVELTPAGKMFYEGIEPILDQYRHFIDEFKSRAHGKEHQLQVYLSIKPPTLVAALSRLRAMDASLPFSISYTSDLPQHYFHYIETVRDSLVITFKSRQLESDRYAVEHLADIPFVAVVPHDHPLAKKQLLSLKADLDGQTIVRLRSKYFSPGWDAIETTLKHHGVRPRFVYSFASSSFELAILNGFKDILLFPECSIQAMPFASDDNYRILEFEENPCFEIVAVWNKGMAEPPCAKQYASLLRDIMSH
ncbi:MAG TPA: LysR family transcriptional regulator [Candidatus Aphodovivens excrementavium]|nr:LysR family transcriptional regulator [Candidatus Aphodovivens excrementavium]